MNYESWAMCLLQVHNIADRLDQKKITRTEELLIQPVFCIVDNGCGSCICYYLLINNYYLFLFLCRSDQPGMWHVTWTILYLIFGREWWPHKATQSKIQRAFFCRHIKIMFCVNIPLPVSYFATYRFQPRKHCTSVKGGEQNWGFRGSCCPRNVLHIYLK